jgi:chromosomal replication initiator protein
MLEEHYVAILRTAIRQELGQGAKLEYQIVVKKPEAVDALAGAGPNHTGDSEDNIINPFAIPGIRKQRLDPQLNPDHTFANYVEGDCNRLARGAGESVAKRPGTTAFNPLVIYGGTGLGKTHLAGAIGNEMLKNFPDKRVFYCQAEDFTNQIVNAIRENTISELTSFYQSVDVLIMDDIQFLSGKEKTQKIFFHMFNQLHQNRKQIILTSDRAPKDLEGLESRLISRFKWGLTADLSKPDVETRMAIFANRIAQEKVEVPREVMEYVCHNVDESIRELEGAIVSLIGRAELLKSKIDLDLAKQVVGSTVRRKNREITVESILDLVCDYFDVTPELVRGQTRKRHVVVARQISMYLAKEHTDCSLKKIGSHFGNRDHSTVIYSCRTVRDLMDTDDAFLQSVNEVSKKLKLHLG